MAMIECRDCKKEISDQQTLGATCPHCGSLNPHMNKEQYAKQSKSDEQSAQIMFVGAGIFILIMMMLMFSKYSG
jgi:phage FluMu protein Com